MTGEEACHNKGLECNCIGEEKEIHSGRRKMTIDSHTRRLKESHKGLKENAKENGMSQMEFDKEFLEIREGLSNLMRLQPKEKEN